MKKRCTMITEKQSQWAQPMIAGLTIHDSRFTF